MAARSLSRRSVISSAAAAALVLPYHDPSTDSLYPNLSREQLEGLLFLFMADNAPARRVQRGFTRAGQAIGSLTLLGGLISLAVYLWNGWPLIPNDIFVVALLCTGAALVLFLIFYGMGWILSAFFSNRSR